ncbi:MAG: transposase, partial [Schwartzia sp.]|nr:transposase [Schwartzia sp. (in: firmicutes)]
SLCIISEMFRLEKGWRGLTQEERLERRKEELAPLIGRFFEEARKAEGSSGFDRSCDEGKAVLYFLDREASFRKLLEDGSVPLSTNDIERCNIAIALTRKRAKAFDSTEGADAAAGYFSLISTAEANGVNPEKYLKFLLTVMPSVIYEHRGEIEAYIKYQEEAAQRFKEVKEGRKQNSKAADEIDWNGLKEPGLDFLFPLLPGGEALSAFLELDDGPDRKAILDAMTRKNLEESTVSVETMRRILYTGKNLANESLNGLRDVLAAMPAQSGKSMSSHNPKEEIVKGMHVFKAHYPERLFEICEMRGRHFLQPPSGGGGMEGPLTGTAELTSPPMHTAPCGMPGGCPPPGDATGAA